MRKITFTGLVVLVAALFVVASSALASGHKGGPAVIKSGKCSGSSHWKLKAKADDGRIETEFQVDENHVGRAWRVALIRNGSVAFRGLRTTKAPSGSFTVRRLLAASAGTTKIAASAKSIRTGETCRASLAL
jgi:hypothetical protein